MVESSSNANMIDNISRKKHTQIRRKPLNKITLDDEIPDEPFEKFEMPNDEDYGNLLKELDIKIGKIEKSIV